MGNRTLSLGLVFRALFLDNDAYDQLRDDDNPFIEGLFLIVIIGAVTALLNLIGQGLAWAGTPAMSAIKEAVWQAFPTMQWWSPMAGNAELMKQFEIYYNMGWQIFPTLFGAPDPGSAALNIVLWPLMAVLGWLIYGTLAHWFARMLGGAGRYGQTLGTLSLSFTPLLLRGLGFLPYFTVGAVMNTWQLICRYKAIRSAGQMSWGRAFWATLLPFLVYLVFWVIVGVVGSLGLTAAISAMKGR
ncbi:MAG: hypothetical protein QG637_268 [Chloroflexota bacterium]|nr:hypothetical protein [Chloroflexota bacterium]